MSNLPWRSEWSAISAKIKGLVEAGNLFFKSIEKYSEDSFGTIRKVLFPQAEKTYLLIDNFREDHENQLPEQAISCINEFLKSFRKNFTDPVPSSTFKYQLQVVQNRLISLASFRTELEYHLSNFSDQIRRTAERAFEHLQRCIVADSNYQEKWTSAFKKGEVYCEKLGAIHLLWHGIWGFKVSAEGGRTDLVMGEKIDNPSQVESAFGLILTEWKRGSSSSEAEEKLKEARIQAQKYSVGVLGGIELISPRYIVIVTKDYITLPNDIEIGDIKYRHLNIATEPSVPSTASRKLA